MSLRLLATLVALILGTGVIVALTAPAAVRAADSPRITSAVKRTTRVEVTIPRQSLDQYVRHATDIVRGRVTSQREVYRDRGIDYTVVSLAVDARIKGHANDVLEIKVAGTRNHPTHRTLVRAAPTFATGDEVLLFLDRHEPDAMPGILGLSQGVYRISDDGGQRIVTGMHAGASSLLDAFESDLRGRMEQGTTNAKATNGEVR